MVRTQSNPEITANYLINSWKQNSNNEDLINISNDCFLNYMQLHGFPDIVRIYKGGHEVVFDNQQLMNCNIVGVENLESLLKSLGSFRKYAIEFLFQIAKKEIPDSDKHFYTAAGSTNVTSDYDLTVSGPYSCLLIEKMFNKFYELFGVVLSIAFDTNLYPSCASFPTVDGYNSIFKGPELPKGYLRLDIGGKLCILPVNNNPKSIVHSYQWCCVKLSKAFLP